MNKLWPAVIALAFGFAAGWLLRQPAAHRGGGADPSEISVFRPLPLDHPSGNVSETTKLRVIHVRDAGGKRDVGRDSSARPWQIKVGATTYVCVPAGE